MNENKALVLLVDDDPNNLTVLFDVLDTGNYDIRIAKNGESCLEIVGQEEADLILLDVMMPGMNGFEVCSRLKSDRKTRNIPVIFMTALSETINKIRGFELGAVDYITKPFQVEEVMSRIRTHVRLRKLLKKEEEADRLKSLLSSLATHDLRTPLNMVSAANTYLKMYGDRLAEEEKSVRHGMIEDSVKKMLHILENISDFSKAEARQTFFSAEHISVSHFCKNIFEEFTALIRASHKFEFSCESDDMQIFADPLLLHHLLHHLLTNAFAYSPPGSEVSLTVHRKDGEICISVRDEGKGIPEKEQKQIFEAFRRGEDSQGSGLGLSIANHVAQMHKGRIEVQSQEAKGAVFTLHLPENKNS